jgi:S1-C subfamily serine protease
MSRASFVSTVCLALLPAVLAVPSCADDIAGKGRAIFNQHRGAVTTVQIVVKAVISTPSGPPRTNDTRHAISGTVVSPAGLVAVSLSAVDPGQAIKNMVAAQNPKLKVEVSLQDVDILLEDGTQAPAEVVFRDKELDLAFVRPKAKLPAPVSAIDLAQSGKAEVLDELIALNRLGSAGGRAYSASLERVSAIIQQPRLFYIPDANMTTATVGAPVFTVDGKVLGIFVIRTSTTKSAGGMLDAPADGITAIILPAQEILNAAAKVPPPGEAKETK